MSKTPSRKNLPPVSISPTYSQRRWDRVMRGISEFNRRWLMVSLTLTEGGKRMMNALGPGPFAWYPHAIDYETFLKWWTSQHGFLGLRPDVFRYAEARGYIQPRPWIQSVQAETVGENQAAPENPPTDYITIAEAVRRHPKLNENAIYAQLKRQRAGSKYKKLDVFKVGGRTYLDPDQVERYADDFKPRRRPYS